MDSADAVKDDQHWPGFFIIVALDFYSCFRVYFEQLFIANIKQIIELKKCSLYINWLKCKRNNIKL